MINSPEDFIKDLRINCVIADLDTNSFFERAEAKQLDVNTFHREGGDFTKRYNDSHLTKFITYNYGDIIRVNEFLNANNWLLFDPEIIEDAKTWPTSLTLTAPELYQILRRRSRLFRERALKSIGNYQAMTELLDALNQHKGEARFAELCSKYDTNLDVISKVISIVSFGSDSLEDPASQLMLEERTEFLLWLQQRNFDALCSEYRKSTAEKILRKKSVELSWLFDQEATIGDWEPHAYLKLCESCINSIKAEFKDDSYNRSLQLWKFSYKQLLLTLSQWPNSIQEIVLNSNLIPFFMSPIVDAIEDEVVSLEPHIKQQIEEIEKLLSEQSVEEPLHPGVSLEQDSNAEKVLRLCFYGQQDKMKSLAQQLSDTSREFVYLYPEDIIPFYYSLCGRLVEGDERPNKNNLITWRRYWPSLKYMIEEIYTQAMIPIDGISSFISRDADLFQFENGQPNKKPKKYSYETTKESLNSSKIDLEKMFPNEERAYLNEIIRSLNVKIDK